RVRRPQRAEEHRGRETVVEAQRDADAEDERDREGERCEGPRASAIGRELVQVELEAREKHEEEDPEVAERLDDTLPLNPVEDARPDQEASQDDADDPRESEPLEQQRPEEDDREADEEDPFRRRRRKFDPEQHAVSLQRAPDGETSSAMQRRDRRTSLTGGATTASPSRSGRGVAWRGCPRRCPADPTPRRGSTRRGR